MHYGLIVARSGTNAGHLPIFVLLSRTIPGPFQLLEIFRVASSFPRHNQSLLRAPWNTVSVTEGSRLHKLYAPLTKYIFLQYTDIRRIDYSVRIALNVTSLSKVNIEEYSLAANSSLNIGLSYTLLVTYGCVSDLSLPLLALRNHA
eukprot:6213515-Pleurochrysis_carterae.AAC.4